MVSHKKRKSEVSHENGDRCVVVMLSLCEMSRGTYLQTRKLLPGSNFFEIRRYFSKIAGNSADTAVNFPKTADAPLS